MLLGFFLGPDLQVAELSVYRWAGYIDDVDLRDKVMQSLADLVEERPEAMVLMRGRTFARVVH